MIPTRPETPSPAAVPGGDRRDGAPPPRVDVFELARSGGRLAGRMPVARLSRLASLLADDTGALDWQVEGGQANVPGLPGGRRPVLSVTASGVLRMRCVRCLEPVEVPLAVDRAIALARDERAAESEDMQAEEHDVIAGSDQFDLSALIEDEAILALEPVPAHETCPVPLALPEAAEAEPEAAPERPNPFAALAALKRDNGPN